MAEPAATSLANPPPANFRGIATSLALIAVTLVIGSFCIITLAATLTQGRITSLTIDGVAVNIWKLDGIRVAWNEIKTQQRAHANEQAKYERELSALQQNTADLGERNINANTTVLDLLGQVAIRAQAADPDLAGALHQETDLEKRLEKVRAAQAALRAKPELGLGTVLDALDRALEDYRKTTNALLVASARGNDIVERARKLDELQKQDEKLAEAVLARLKNPLDPPTRIRIENALYELGPSSEGKSLMNWLVTQHPDVLALSLVILMGMLGSSLQMLLSFYRFGRAEPIGWYFLRLSAGAITALVIFIVAKAGVPVIADASRLSGDAPINPYFVSFLAIISGLLSERAVISVQNQGERLFGGTEGEPDRWARADVEKQLTAQGLTAKTLGDYLGRNEEETDAIVKGEQKATPEQQRTIAVYLRQEQRELFTDIPPKGR